MIILLHMCIQRYCDCDAYELNGRGWILEDVKRFEDNLVRKACMFGAEH